MSLRCLVRSVLESGLASHIIPPGMRWHCQALWRTLVVLAGAHLSGPPNLKRRIWKALHQQNWQQRSESSQPPSIIAIDAADQLLHASPRT